MSFPGTALIFFLRLKTLSSLIFEVDSVSASAQNTSELRKQRKAIYLSAETFETQSLANERNASQGALRGLSIALVLARARSSLRSN